MKIGDAIKKLRKSLKISQKEFSTLCDISQTYLSQIENNRKTPNFNIIEIISQKTSIPIPVILFLSLEDSDVKDDKKDTYNMFKPTIDNFIKNIFLKENDKKAW